MTVREMHLELDQSLQQIASHRTRKFLAEEKDWILNKIYNRFIQSRIVPRKDGSGGFEVNQLQADSIRTLIVNTELDAYVDQSNRRYKCILPHDYSYLLSDWSETTPICNGVGGAVSSAIFPLYSLRLTQTSKGAAPFYETIATHIVNDVTFPTDLNYGHQYTGFQRKDDISFLRQFIALKGRYYWERFGDIYRPGYFLQPKYTSGTITPTLIVDGTNITTTDTTSLSYIKHLAGTGAKIVDNRLTASSKVAGLNGTAFYNTAAYSPITELQNNLLYVYYDNSFTVSRVGITYIRKYVPISLSLGSNCELPEEFHQTICDLATEYMKGRLGDVQGEQLTQNDNENRVIL